MISPQSDTNLEDVLTRELLERERLVHPRLIGVTMTLDFGKGLRSA